MYAALELGPRRLVARTLFVPLIPSIQGTDLIWPVLSYIESLIHLQP